MHGTVLSRGCLLGHADAPAGACAIVQAPPGEGQAEGDWECRPLGHLQPLELLDVGWAGNPVPDCAGW